MNRNQVISEINKILTLEHVHLGMYKNFLDYNDKRIRRTFRRFMEIEVEHINKLKSVLYNLEVKPLAIIETGDMMGKLFGVTVKNVTDLSEIMRMYSFIEKKSHEGYSKFITSLDNNDKLINQFISEVASSNMLEAELMHLWLDNELKAYLTI